MAIGRKFNHHILNVSVLSCVNVCVNSLVIFVHAFNLQESALNPKAPKVLKHIMRSPAVRLVRLYLINITSLMAT
jgi:hypothetical protein